MAITLRPARPEDADTVASLWQASRRVHLPDVPQVHDVAAVRRWVAGPLLNQERVTLAISGGEVIGMAALRSDDDMAWLTQLYLLPGHTGQGIGTLLLHEALRGSPGRVRLYCFQRNAGARAFYERHGFRPIAFGDGQYNEERCADVLYERASQGGQVRVRCEV